MRTYLDRRKLIVSFHFKEGELGREREDIEDESLELDAIDARSLGALNLRPGNTFPRDMVRALRLEKRCCFLEKGQREVLHAQIRPLAFNMQYVHIHTRIQMCVSSSPINHRVIVATEAWCDDSLSVCMCTRKSV